MPKNSTQPRTTVTCSDCGHEWRTECVDPTKARCPRCRREAATANRERRRTHTPDTHRLETSHDVARKELVRQLAGSWSQIKNCWMERGDQLFQDRSQRILIDQVGVFLYRLNGNGWDRIQGCCHYDLGLIQREFERV
jgi:hypothetical protein